ncbi:fluoride efflux transporter CrcB [Mesobacillus zeae]|uniref:Fluoride-specific ion channel FluC n=1 Tax=Mesobacillus zeae TaxID=1917180 RepID=A0A398B7S7_9BACI|nr:fluoride efflux transporter CrcB [Mesobacillus zeae]RID85581.1 fluoride efflux transporter CrcB [Mesobacillus zeae]
MNYIGIGVGGIIGSLLRYGAGLLVAGPFSTLAVNLSGSLILGWFTARVVERKALPEVLTVSIGTGILGSFTTFSTFSLDSLRLLEEWRLMASASYMMISGVGGLTAAYLGYHAGKKKMRQEEEGKY